jgi:DUF1680 family protein
MYLLSAVADLAHENDDPTLLETCEWLWDNLIIKRLYLTGAIGSSRQNEGFTLDYDLPDETAYAETCATIGLILWNHRLLQFTGESKYADVIERGLYNGFLSGVSLDGTRFFYENPLASAGGHHRQSWFECPCCPPNIARTLASLGDYFYSTGINDVWVHLFAQGSVKLEVNQSDVSLRQVTKYPWDGNVKFEIGVANSRAFTLHLRVPGWCEQWLLRINGTPIPHLRPLANGYLAIDREWHPRDVVEYQMEMPIQSVWAHPTVRDMQGRIAIQRGPIVYCLESVDHRGFVLDQIVVNPKVVSSEFGTEHQDNSLGGVIIVRGKGFVVDERDWEGRLYRYREPSLKSMEIKAIPYYAWDNRAPGEMRVWLRSTS